MTEHDPEKIRQAFESAAFWMRALLEGFDPDEFLLEFTDDEMIVTHLPTMRVRRKPRR